MVEVLVAPSCTSLNNQILVWNFEILFDVFTGTINANHFSNTVILLFIIFWMQLLTRNSCRLNQDLIDFSFQ